MLLCCLETTKTLMWHQASFPSYFLFLLLLAIAWSRIRNICNHLCVQRDFILNFFLGSQCLCRRLTSLANSIASLRRNMVRNSITHWFIFLGLFRIIGNSNIYCPAHQSLLKPDLSAQVILLYWTGTIPTPSILFLRNCTNPLRVSS